MSENIEELFHVPSSMTEFVPIKTFCGLFPIGEVSMIVGQAGVGKSWLVLHAMINGSYGLDVCGNDCKHFNQNSEWLPSLCFSGELSENAIMLRERLLRKSIWKRSITPFITTEGLALHGYIPTLTSDEDGEKFKACVQEAVKASKAKAVFFDSLVSFNGGDENSTNDMSALFNWMLTFAKSNNLAVVISHHLRKRGKGEIIRTIDDVAGNSVMPRLCQTVYIVEKIREGDSSSSTFAMNTKGYLTRLHVRQLRNASLIVDPFILQIETREEDTGEISTMITEKSFTTLSVESADGKEIIPDNEMTRNKKAKIREIIMKTLPETGTPLSATKINEIVCNTFEKDYGTGVTERYINSVLNELFFSGGKIYRQKRGKEFFYSSRPFEDEA